MASVSLATFGAYVHPLAVFASFLPPRGCRVIDRLVELEKRSLRRYAAYIAREYVSAVHLVNHSGFSFRVFSSAPPHFSGLLWQTSLQ